MKSAAIIADETNPPVTEVKLVEHDSLTQRKANPANVGWDDEDKKIPTIPPSVSLS